MKTTLLISVAALITTHVALAQYGTLDVTFDDDGKVSTEFGSYKSAVRSLALQLDGKIIAAGSTYNNGSYHRFAVARYNNDGSLDTSFGTEGRVVGDFPEEKMAITSVFVQPDGKIIGSGIIYNQYFDSEFMMVRFNADGSIDSGFGNNGMVSEGSLTINSVKMQPDGKIVAAGFNYSQTGSQRDIAVLRFNTDGTIDTSFAQNGYFITSVGVRDYANSLSILPDGKIVIGGAIFNGNHSDFCVIRLLPDGSPDPDFGLNGIASYDYDENDEITSICLQPDGKLVFSGFTGDDDNEYLYAVMRINEDGSVDHGFGDDGLVTGEGGSMAKKVEVEPSGKILVAGAYGGGNNKTASMLRFNHDGTLDPEFGENGLITTTFSSSCQANAVVLQPDGKILLGGEAGSTGGTYNPDFALMRYHSGPELSIGEQDMVRSTFMVYPNPVVNSFNLEMQLAQAETLSVDLIDIHGRKICNFAERSQFGIGLTSTRFTLPDNLNKGTYFLKIGSANDNKVVRIIK